ncbi:hypothetical protein V2E39_01040 [Chryseobacterium arthrosphaerae]|uniref:Uncharacterized protein n=1 Tax=Chryseobacterium arthrosphaerae TaxID=651561 RepID=A0ABU7QTV8_9FLAO|nr:hypothetical protein [Chryseobacterium arthrosphaerae]
MKTKNLFTVILLLVAMPGWGQAQITVIPKNSSINVIKENDLTLAIPIEYTVIKATDDKTNTLNKITYDVDTNNSEVEKWWVRNTEEVIDLRTNSEKSIKTYLFIEKDVKISYNSIIFLKIKSGTASIGQIQITIQPDDKILTLDEYMKKDKEQNKRNNQLDYVTKVESNNNILTVSGYKNNEFTSRKIKLNDNQGFAVFERRWFTPSKLKEFANSISIYSIPFKIRPGITAQIDSKNQTLHPTSNGSVSNIGVNLEITKAKWDIYTIRDNIYSHKFSLGLWVGPSVEELDITNTSTFPTDISKSKQLFISTGITISYSFNNFSFVFVPAGWDWGTSTLGKTWAYEGKRWWGFGIGISPKIFSTLLNGK